MEQIIIRVFDPETKEFAYSDQPGMGYAWKFEVTGIVCWVIAPFCSDEKDHLLEGPYELWSTIQDINGEDLYAGDVVEVGLASGRTIAAEIVFIDGCFEVQADNAYFRMKSGSYSNRDYLKCYTANHAVKKIGNIHITPELLGKRHG